MRPRRSAQSASRLMGLDGEQTANALAIATSRALGYNAQFGSEAKPLQVGFAVDGGIVAAHLAATGLTGQPHMLEHPTGMVALMGHRFTDRIETAMAKLGSVPAIDEYHIVFKPWPSCGYTHRIMTGMLELRTRGIAAAAIEKLELHLPDMHAGILPYRHPGNRGEALFSLPYCAASGLLRGDLTIADLDNQSWRDEDIRQLIDKTSVICFTPNRPKLNYDPEQPDRVVVTINGATHAVDIPYPLGSPQRPMSEALHLRKFQMNTGLEETRARKLRERLGTWPSSGNIHDLFVSSPCGG